jgi:DUF4097 and DUF4098 domain-containing protein YvlB
VRHLPSTPQRSRPVRRILRRSLWLLLIPLGVVLAAGPARLEKTFDTTRTPQVILSNLRGQVVVRGWEKAQVHTVCIMVSPRVEVDADALPRTGAAERVQFATHVLDPLVTGNEETADCTLEVPLGASLEIKNRQGGVQIENLQGQHAHVESADGLISAKDVAGHLVARSLGGDIQIVRASGRVEAVSITGSVRIIAPTSKNLRANTNSGQIVYQGDFVPAGEYILSTYSGDIDLLCPPSASFELNARSVKGKLHNTLSLAPKRHVPFPVPAANSLLGTHNTGNATVELTSFSGTIRVRQQP